VFGRAAAVLLLLAPAACGGDQSESGAEPQRSSPVPTADPAALPRVAPYLDVTNGLPDLATIADRTGQTDYTLAFLLATGADACAPAWSGTLDLDDPTMTVKLDAIAVRHGRVVVASGGPTGTPLEKVCSAEELTAAYTSALIASGTNFLDVDIEQDVDPAPVAAALFRLQTDRETRITLTLPVAADDPHGLTEAGIALLRACRAAGVEITVNALTRNFVADGDWGDAMVGAAEAVAGDVRSVWTDRSDRQVHAMLGVTPMIGKNDTGVVTTAGNAKTLLAYARQQGLGFVRFWSANRDNGGCTDGRVHATCSGVGQTDYVFTSVFATFQR
jgi:chitinase